MDEDAFVVCKPVLNTSRKEESLNQFYQNFCNCYITGKKPRGSSSTGISEDKGVVKIL